MSAASNNIEARRIAAHIVDPVEADWNRIALFAATCEVEPGVAQAVREHIEQDARPVAGATRLADYLEKVE